MNDSGPKYQFEEFNHRRAMRGAPAARVRVNDPEDEEGTYLLWMSKADIGRNIMEFGRHHAFVEAWEAYAKWKSK